jgi:NADH dehydrogenase
MHVHLLEASPRLLNGLSLSSGKSAEGYLSRLGVHVHTAASVRNYDGYTIRLSNGKTLFSRCLIWAAGVKGIPLDGLPGTSVFPNGRLSVDNINRVVGFMIVYAIGDIAMMCSKNFTRGHPQVAPVAMQQAALLAKNLERLQTGVTMAPFNYKDKGSMATVGRNLAVAEVGKFKMKGFIAWIVWMMVHLMSIIGLKNRLFILINWVWQYVTYDQSLRLIIRPSEKKPKTIVYHSLPGAA